MTPEQFRETYYEWLQANGLLEDESPGFFLADSFDNSGWPNYETVYQGTWYKGSLVPVASMDRQAAWHFLDDCLADAKNREAVNSDDERQ